MAICFSTKIKIEIKNCTIPKLKRMNLTPTITFCFLCFVLFFFIQITRKQNVKFLYNSFSFQVC